MTQRTPSLLHIALASLGITFLVLLALLLLPGPAYDPSASPASELARAQRGLDDAEGLRANLLAWAGAGIAIGSAIGSAGALVLLRRASKELEEGR